MSTPDGAVPNKNLSWPFRNPKMAIATYFLYEQDKRLTVIVIDYGIPESGQRWEHPCKEKYCSNRSDITILSRKSSSIRASSLVDALLVESI